MTSGSGSFEGSSQGCSGVTSGVTVAGCGSSLSVVLFKAVVLPPVVLVSEETGALLWHAVLSTAGSDVGVATLLVLRSDPSALENVSKEWILCLIDDFDGVDRKLTPNVLLTLGLLFSVGFSCSGGSCLFLFRLLRNHAGLGATGGPFLPLGTSSGTVEALCGSDTPLVSAVSISSGSVWSAMVDGVGLGWFSRLSESLTQGSCS